MLRIIESITEFSEQSELTEREKQKKDSERGKVSERCVIVKILFSLAFIVRK